MDKILTIKEAIRLTRKLKNDGKTIVLAGGCFDILHIGHLEFLKKAKEKGNILIVLLESDENVKKLKGIKRPFHNQKDRAEILSFISLIDYVVLLPYLKTNEYDDIVIRIKPDSIATTKGDKNRMHKERQAKKIQGVVYDVIPRIKNMSSDRKSTRLNSSH